MNDLVLVNKKLKKLDVIENKLDLLLDSDLAKINTKKYLTAKEVEALTGLDHRTILNRSNKDRHHHLYIPSVQFGSRRKYFERKVIERIFHLT